MEMTNEEMLAIKFYSFDLQGEITIKGFLIELLQSLWRQAEGFSGKRPFGNSGWQDPIIDALAENGCIKEAEFDEGNELMKELIGSL